MLLRPTYSRRGGSILPLVVVSLTALLAFVALALDLGLMAVARNQCQNAADSAAMAGARTLNGDATTSNNKANAVVNAQAAASVNSVLGKAVQVGQAVVTIGKYYYQPATTSFVAWPVDPGSSDNANQPWTLASATVTVNNSQTGFARVLGVNSFNTTATATAVHRPRDIAIIADFSGSMRFDSMLSAPHYGYRTQSQNPDPVVPLFGHYSDTIDSALSYTGNFQVSSGELIGQANDVNVANSNYALVKDFYQDAAPLGNSTPAFTSAGNGDAVGWVAGDKPLKTSLNKGSGYAQTVQDVVNATARDPLFDQPIDPTIGAKVGYDDPRLGPLPPFAGYTQGPTYWGKTFFIWPPDPRLDKDWRRKFFLKSDGVTPLDDNNLLWDASGNMQVPADGTNDNYRINYTAILAWIKNTGPAIFPPQLRAGGVLYYDSIPLTIDTSVFPPTDPNQRFWKEYIDEVLGVWQTGGSGSSPIYYGAAITPYTGFGDDFAWGTPQISVKPTDGRYMDYTDNPRRPKAHFWFGPMSMVDFLGNYNLSRFWWPGTAHESPTFVCKLGIQAALQDIEKNHPNDNVALTFFSSPKTAYNSSGFYNKAAVPLGRSYTTMTNSLWFAPRTIASPTPEIRPYDNGGNDITSVPKANGGTCYAMPLMLTYNQFSGSSTLQSYATFPAPAGQAGGNGRKGAQKLIIFETDGMVNTTASAGFTNIGPYASYYNVRIQDGTNSGANEYPTGVGGGVSTATAQALDIANQICALDTAASPGYSTTGKPVLIHTIAFGTLFDPTNGSFFKANALNLLQNLQYIGGKAGGEQVDPTTPLASYKIVVGSYDNRIQNLQNAFDRIMQDGVQVSLIR